MTRKAAVARSRKARKATKRTTSVHMKGARRMQNVEWNLVAEVLEMSRRVYLYSTEPGLGKTFTALARARVKGHKLFSQTLNADLSVQELMGMFLPSAGEAQWINGPIIEALKLSNSEPVTLILNEIHRAAPPVHDFLLGIIDNDESRCVGLPNGEMVTGGERLQIIATANEPLSCMTYALQDRFETALEVTTPHPEMVERLNAVMPGLGTVVERAYTGKTSQLTRISARRALSFAGLRRLGMSESNAAKAVFGALGASVPRDFLAAFQILAKEAGAGVPGEAKAAAPSSTRGI